MADAVAPPAVAAPRAGQPAPSGSGVVGMVLRMVFMWWLMSWFKGAKNPQQGAKLDPVSYSFPKFNKGELVDCYVFLTETASVRGGHYDLADLIWSETSVALAAQDPRNISYVYEPSKNVQNNGSLYLHAVLAKAGETINPADPDYNEDLVFGRAFSKYFLACSCVAG
ncbi:uncharacterized protein HaLaN_21276 [Haematococcus lacustris]|uniref:Uncharacterized protein n=1 Tax=Haematococcus lacustris TaxID=44745 RepID=A0A699ZNX5_HAELA|nr:uncharacterized protein HaLaN_21276 [Haematococcus lacustris]